MTKIGNTGGMDVSLAALQQQAAELAASPEKVVGQLAGLVSGLQSLQVAAGSQGAQDADGAADMPELDAPEVSLDGDEVQANLAKLVAFLQMETDEQQVALAKERIETQKAQLEKTHESQMQKIQESIEAAEKAKKMSFWTRLFSFILAAVAVIAAVVSVATCVATGGAALPATIATVMGAVLAVGMVVSNETGLTEKIVDAIAKSLQENFGLNKNESQFWAQMILMAIMLVASIATMGVGMVGGAAASVSQVGQTVQQLLKVGEVVTKVMPYVNAGMQLANATLGAVGSKFNADAGNASADSKEIEKFIVWLQQQLDETSEELQALMDALTRCVSGLAAMIDSEAQTKDEIAGQMGMMV